MAKRTLQRRRRGFEASPALGLEPGDKGLSTRGLLRRHPRSLVCFNRGADQPDGECGGGEEQHDSNRHSDQRSPHHAPCLFCLALLSLLPLRQRLGSVGLRCSYLFKLPALGILPSRLGLLAHANELIVKCSGLGGILRPPRGPRFGLSDAVSEEKPRFGASRRIPFARALQ